MINLGNQWFRRVGLFVTSAIDILRAAAYNIDPDIYMIKVKILTFTCTDYILPCRRRGIPTCLVITSIAWKSRCIARTLTLLRGNEAEIRPAL